MALKVLVFSDVHGHGKGLAYIQTQVQTHSPDLVLVAGDATDYQEPGASLDVYNELGCEVFLVPGNMDRFASVEGYPNVTNIHALREERGGIGFVGFGAVHMGDLDLTDFLSDIVRPGDVLLTHFPSKGYNDRTRSGNHAGSKRIAAAVRDLKMSLHISGHIHESPGVVRDGGIHYINPGPAYEHRGVLVFFNDGLSIEAL